MTGSRAAHEESGQFHRSRVQASCLQLSCHARSCPAYRPMPAGPPVITRGNVKKDGGVPYQPRHLVDADLDYPCTSSKWGFEGRWVVEGADRR